MDDSCFTSCSFSNKLETCQGQKRKCFQAQQYTIFFLNSDIEIVEPMCCPPFCEQVNKKVKLPVNTLVNIQL